MHRRRDHRQVGRVAVHRPQPAARPHLLLDAHHRGVRVPHPVEEQQVEAGHEHHDEGQDDDRPGLVERIPAPTVEPIHRGVGGRERSPEPLLHRADDRYRHL